MKNKKLFSVVLALLLLLSSAGQSLAPIVYAQEPASPAVEAGSVQTESSDAPKPDEYMPVMENETPTLNEETPVPDAETPDVPVSAENLLSEPETETIEVKFDTDGAAPIEPRIIKKGEALGDLPLPEKEGFEFVGWLIALEFEEFADEHFVPEEDITLKAAWEKYYIESNPDHLAAPDASPHAGIINYGVYPATAFAIADSLLPLRARRSSPPVIGVDHPQNPGEVMLFKQARPVEGRVNTWEVTLRIEAKDKKTTSDIVLVIDRSGSMNDNGRMQAAKDAAKAFVDALLPSETTRIGVVSFSDNVYVNQALTKNSENLKNAIDWLSADGGTFTQAGVKQAKAMLANSEADNKHIVILSDGEPTYSYKMHNPDDYLVPLPNDSTSYETNTLAPKEAYNYDARVGNGRGIRWRYNNWNWFAPPRYYNHGNSAIAEAGFAKAAARVWTIALEVSNVGKGVLERMASTDSYFTADSESLSNIFSSIAGQIGYAITNAEVSDPMGPGFEIPDANLESIVTVPETPAATYDSVNKKITWNPGTLTTPIEAGSDIKYAELKYTIEINDEILKEKADDNGEYPTNGEAKISYNDVSGDSQVGNFPVPKVNPVFYTVEKELKDKYGETPTDSGLQFTIVVKGPWGGEAVPEKTFVLDANGSTALLTDLRTDSEYTFEETGDLSDYEVKYYVNGQEVTGDNRKFACVQ